MQVRKKKKRKKLDRLVILGSEQVAEGLENSLSTQVDNLRHLCSNISGLTN